MNGRINKDGSFVYEVKCQFAFRPEFKLDCTFNIDLVLEQLKKEVLKQYQEDLEEYECKNK